MAMFREPSAKPCDASVTKHGGAFLKSSFDYSVTGFSITTMLRFDTTLLS